MACNGETHGGLLLATPPPQRLEYWGKEKFVSGECAGGDGGWTAHPEVPAELNRTGPHSIARISCRPNNGKRSYLLHAWLRPLSIRVVSHDVANNEVSTPVEIEIGDLIGRDCDKKVVLEKMGPGPEGEERAAVDVGAWMNGHTSWALSRNINKVLLHCFLTPDCQTSRLQLPCELSSAPQHWGPHRARPSVSPTL